MCYTGKCPFEDYLGNCTKDAEWFEKNDCPISDGTPYDLIDEAIDRWIKKMEMDDGT